MSEFFKALEQAERDRQLAEAAEPTASVTVDAKGKTPDPASAGESEQAAEKPLPDVPSAAAAAPAPPPVAPPPGRAARPRATSFFGRPPEPPRPAPQPPSAAPRVPERPVWSPRERLAPPEKPAVPEKPVVLERPVSRVPERPAPPAPERPAVPAAAAMPSSAPVVSAGTTPAAPSQPVGAPPVEKPDVPVTPPPPIQQATVNLGKRSKAPVLIADLDPRSVAAEAYRTLRANLEFGSGERGCRSVVVTSPSMGEGKSTTAANLAVVAAQGGSRVCLVDADMRRPVLHKLFGVSNRGGFTRALSQGLALTSVAAPTDIPNLSLVVAGSSDGLQPAQLLNPPRLQRVLRDRDAFDLVLFDTPPVMSVADAMNLAPHSDGVLLVVRAGALTPTALQRAVRQITHVNAKVVGVVLTQVDFRRGDAEYYRHYRAYHSNGTRD